jgi:hypothetical protein
VTRSPHTYVYKGKRVFIRTKDGEKYEAKFVEKHSKRIVVERDGHLVTIPKNKLASMTIHRN